MTADRDEPKQNEPGVWRRRLTDRPEEWTIHRSGNPDFAGLVIDDPHIVLERGQLLFAEGDPTSSMYIVKSGALQIRSGSVIYEDVGQGGIVGEMSLVERHQTRSVTVYALTDSELVEIDGRGFPRSSRRLRALRSR
jgi:CRP-like cAMP-binding protein